MKTAQFLSLLVSSYVTSLGRNFECHTPKQKDERLEDFILSCIQQMSPAARVFLKKEIEDQKLL